MSACAPTADVSLHRGEPPFRARKRREQVQRNCQCAGTSPQKTHQAKADRAPRSFCFRRDLRYLASRVAKAGPAGVEFDPQGQLTIPPLTPGELKELPGLARTKVMGELEADLHKQLQLFDADKRLDLTVHYLAQSRLEQLFEWCRVTRPNSCLQGVINVSRHS